MFVVLSGVLAARLERHGEDRHEQSLLHGRASVTIAITSARSATPAARRLVVRRALVVAQHRQLCGDQRLETAPAAGEEPLAGGGQADQRLPAIGVVHAPFDPAAPHQHLHRASTWSAG